MNPYFISVIIILVILLVIVLIPIAQILLLLTINLLTSLYFYIYKKLHYSEYEVVDKRTFWHRPLVPLARIWNFVGRFYHGYEIVGIEKIPKQGPAIIVLHHGKGPVDAFFFLPRIFLELDRKVVTIVDKNNKKIMPGYEIFAEALEHSPGTIEWCVETIENGDLLAIYPGGTREAMLTDTYEVIWRDNAGFAKIALQTNAPIIPVFTQNVRECFLSLNIFNEYFKNLYRKTKIAVPLVFGWWPIKMRSFVGDPIQYESTDSVEEVVRKSREGMEKLIKEHQRIPNSVFRSILDRF